ncbi:hypothetical protein VE03_10568, partial [Pseudogymnoascus sp. 23342-1-I1]
MEHRVSATAQEISRYQGWNSPLELKLARQWPGAGSTTTSTTASRAAASPADWSLPHFEKMLCDNARLLHMYLDTFLGLPKPGPELLSVVHDLAAYLLNSFYRRGDKETREGAYYVWTAWELESSSPPQAYDVVAAFSGVNPNSNVRPSRDVATSNEPARADKLPPTGSRRASHCLGSATALSGGSSQPVAL